MENLEVKVTEIDQRSKSNVKRLDKMEARQDEQDKIVTAIATLDTRMGGVESDVTEIKSDVKELAAKPGKRWDAVIAALITGAVGLLLGYLASAIIY